MKLPIDNLTYPVRLLIGGNSGSGFFIRNKKEDVYLVTAKHVLYQQDQIKKDFHLIDNKLTTISYTHVGSSISKEPLILGLDLNLLTKEGDLKIHPSADLVVIKLGSSSKQEDSSTILNFLHSIKIQQEQGGRLIHYPMEHSRLFEKVEITNNVYVLGYPSSLSTSEMKQIDYDSPLVRKGIIAGKNRKNKTLILDCPVYGGNSGGLVLEMNQINPTQNNIHLVGIVVEFIPFIDQWKNIRFPDLYNTNIHNSGYSVALPVDFIFDLIEKIESN